MTLNSSPPRHRVSARQLIGSLLLAGCLSAALVGYDRIAGAAALAWLALLISAAHQAPFAGIEVAVDAVLAACFAVMLTTPRRQPRRIHRGAWLIPVAVLGIERGSPL